MEDVRKLYEERQMAALDKLCREKEDAGIEDFDVYACHAWAQAARNDLSRLSLENGIELFKKAAVLCAGDEGKQKELFENFSKEVLEQLGKAENFFAGITLTAETIQSYRECMRLSADALMEAARFADGISDISTLEIRKTAVLCMVHLCSEYKYEKDLGKSIVKKTDNVNEDIREKYTAAYDCLVEDIQKEDAGYTPEEIQRERIQPGAEAEKKEAEKEGEKPKKKGFFDKLLDFF